MKSALLAAMFLLVSSCATVERITTREPNAAPTVKKLAKIGESCLIDLDGDAESDKVEIGTLLGKQVVVILHKEEMGKPAKFFVEEITNGQSIECVVNQEPGVSFQGTDETQKAVSVPLRADYLKVATPQKDTRFMYYDASASSYKSLWRAN